ncbi:RHS repeat-associated core domain-containing protein [Pseudomonas batumici]|uniref:RHS repeat-associated core domain-containing protein n=1 Tax=Pseudomonas batumici TaxID=226910 RepID=UPI0030D15901
MNTTSSVNLCQSTPTIKVRDNRSLEVRTVAYHRAQVDDPAVARVTRQCFDPRGQLLSEIDPRLFAKAQLGETVAPNFGYQASLGGQAQRVVGVDNGLRLGLADVAGRLLWSSDGQGQQCRRQYDALNRLLAVFEQTAGQAQVCSERFSYGESLPDAAAHNLRGQLCRHRHTAGERQCMSYSLTGLPLNEHWRFLQAPDEPDWPATDRESEALLQAEVSTTHWRYDALGEWHTQTDAAGHRRRLAFNRAGQLARRWLKPKDQPETLLQQDLVYSAAGQVEAETAGNGVRITRVFDPATQRLNHLSARRPRDNVVLQDLRYSYDPVGNVLRIEDASQTTRYFRNQRIDPVNTYAYDSLYQLIEATGRESAQAGQAGATLPALLPLDDASQVVNYRRHYSYDAAGNLLGVQHQGARGYRQDMQVALASNHALPSQTGLTEQDVDGGFDGNGNLRQLDAGQPLQWGRRNQLKRVVQINRSDAAHDDECYAYDGGGRRVRKVRTATSGSQQHLSQTLYLPGLELHQTHQRPLSGGPDRLTEQRQVINDGNVRWLQWTQGRPEALGVDPYRYTLDDHLGSSALELDGEGNLLSHEEYYPFGGTAFWAGRDQLEASYKTIRYSGKERDATGLYDYGYRYYAPWLQRWISADPAGTVDGLNLYAMVRNNPVSFIDPDGCAATILYGMHESRQAFLAWESEGPEKTYITIDMLNDALGISMDSSGGDANVAANYSKIINRIKMGVPVTDRSINYVVSEAMGLKDLNGSGVRALLQSWSDFLRNNVEQVDVIESWKRKYGGSAALKKNGKPSDSFKEGLKKIIRKNYGVEHDFKGYSVLAQAVYKGPDTYMKESKDYPQMLVLSTISGAFFRKTSKLALDWAAEIGNPVLFVLGHATFTEKGLQTTPFGAEVSRKTYKHAKKGGKTQATSVREPITFSEYRHAQKKGYKQISYFGRH